METFEEIWKVLSERNKYDLGTLSDEQVNQLARHYMKEGLHQMRATERMHVFMTEMNQRSSSRVASTGKRMTILAVIIAGISVVVGIVQLVVAFKK